MLSRILRERDEGFIWGLVYISYGVNSSAGCFRRRKEIATYTSREAASRNRKVLIGTGGKYTDVNLHLMKRYARFGEGTYG